MTKVGKSDREETFARASGNDEVAPVPVVRGTLIEPRVSTQIACRRGL